MDPLCTSKIPLHFKKILLKNLVIGEHNKYGAGNKN